MKEIHLMNKTELFNRFRANCRNLHHLGWWHINVVCKRRNDALECLHRLIGMDIKHEWYDQLIYGCAQAIGSYKHCTGYAKQWKQLHARLRDEMLAKKPNRSNLRKKTW